MSGVLFQHGHVHGVTGATALLVADGRVAWTGGDPEAGQLTGVTGRVDLEGAWVAPAFTDAHVHLTMTGLTLDGLDLGDAPSLAAALDRVAAASREARGGPLLGSGWDESTWPEGRPPTAAELDRASHGGVVYLARTDGHSAVASSALLAAVPEAAGLPGYSPEGWVRGEGHHAVRHQAFSVLTPGRRRRAQAAALARAASLGIATVHECGGPDICGEEDFVLALSPEAPGPEVVGYWGELDAVAKARELGAVGAAGDLFADGSLGSHTACLSEPYSDGGVGRAYLDATDVARHVLACTRAGMQAGFHAIGDAALGAVVDGLRRAADEVGVDAVVARRHRVEHAEMLTPDHVDALAHLGVVASVQPLFDERWGGPRSLYAARLGRERALAMNPFAALAAAGVVLALGSDSPVTPLDPWGTLRAAVRHRTPGSGLTPEQAFDAHTRGGAYAAGPGTGRTGTLAVGSPASFSVWDSPGLPDLAGPGPRCLRTVVAGETVFAAT